MVVYLHWISSLRIIVECACILYDFMYMVCLIFFYWGTLVLRGLLLLDQYRLLANSREDVLSSGDGTVTA